MVCDWWIWIRFVCFCVSRFVSCDRNYDRRQRKTQLWRRLLNFRVRMFVKSAVNQKAENLMKQPPFPSLRDNARTYSRGTSAHLFFLSLSVPSRPVQDRNSSAIFPPFLIWRIIQLMLPGNIRHPDVWNGQNACSSVVVVIFQLVFLVGESLLLLRENLLTFRRFNLNSLLRNKEFHNG